jgi:hypothetical protein
MKQQENGICYIQYSTGSRVSISHPFFVSRNTKQSEQKNCFAKFRLFCETTKSAKFRFVLFRLK